MSYTFGQHTIRASEVFFKSKWSYALVNLKPLVPGHVLVCPQRRVERLRDMTHDEICDLFLSVQHVSRVIERAYDGHSMTIAMQDGPEAGQSVFHVHVHVIPRRKGDWERNDDIYPELDEVAKKLDGDLKARVEGLDHEERKPRSAEEMAKEAAWLREQFDQADAS